MNFDFCSLTIKKFLNNKLNNTFCSKVYVYWGKCNANPMEDIVLRRRGGYTPEPPGGYDSQITFVQCSVKK